MAQRLDTHAPHHHFVDFYESDEALAARVATYLAAGRRRGEVAVIISTEAHRSDICVALRATGCDVEAARAEGSLIELGAEELLTTICPPTGLDPGRFDATVGALLRRLLSQRVCAYGEMVDLLWERGDVNGAIALETLWNRLGQECDFQLYCSYRAAGRNAASDALEQVRRLHSDVVSEPAAADAPSAHFPAAASSPLAARRFTHAVLDRWDLDVLQDVAALVVSELSMNAIVHARSPFSVALRRTGGFVRIAVHDDSPVLPESRRTEPHELSGRGLALIEELSDAWGAEPSPVGKTVWADIST